MQGEKGNYKVDYYDGTDEKGCTLIINIIERLLNLYWMFEGKLKGSIYCAGYTAYEFSADDVITHKINVYKYKDSNSCYFG